MWGGAVGAVWCDPLYHSTTAHGSTPNSPNDHNPLRKSLHLAAQHPVPNTLRTAPNTTAAYTTTLYTAAPHTRAQHTIYSPPPTLHNRA